MELVYLWVEKYKNIEKQGFNFSPRFECKYENNELTICDKKKKECKDNNYIENFFGENINVTAIVGKNGSGKSSVLEFCIDKYSKYILLYEIDNQLFINKSISVNNLIQKIDTIDAYHLLEKTELITLNVNTKSQYLNLTHDKKLKLDSNNVTLAMLDSKNIKFTSFFKKIKTIFIEEKANVVDDIQSKTDPYSFYKNNNYKNNHEIERLLEFLKANDTDENKKFNNILQLDMLSSILREEDSCKALTEKLQEKAIKKLSVKEYNNLLQTIFNKYHVKNSLGEIIKNGFNLEKFSSIDKEYKFHKITPEIKEKIEKYHEYLNLFFCSEEGIFFDKLSSGEKIFLGQFALLHQKILNSKKKNIILFFDEPKNAFHPQWQKSYIKEFVDSFSIYQDVKIHLILTSHSPFLLSDIPKQNIIFLDKDEKGNCKVVDGLKEKKQTFGANIHTLLSDSFFMKDSLMGEFAKKKIEDVVKFLQEDTTTTIKSHKEAKQIIDIIGEPVLQMRLKKMLDDYKLKKDIETEEDIQKQIEALQLKLQKRQNG